MLLYEGAVAQLGYPVCYDADSHPNKICKTFMFSIRPMSSAEYDLVSQCVAGLEALGIKKNHIDVLKTNESGVSYWEHMGWHLRTDILRYSFVSSGGANV